jgi:SAM-dependent methyltransferase
VPAPGAISASSASGWPASHRVESGRPLSGPVGAGPQAHPAGLPNVRVIEGDAVTYRPDGPVDCVYFSYSLTMIPNWEGALGNALAMLKPGGRLGVVDFYVSQPVPAPGLTTAWLGDPPVLAALVRPRRRAPEPGPSSRATTAAAGSRAHRARCAGSLPAGPAGALLLLRRAPRVRCVARGRPSSSGNDPAA